MTLDSKADRKNTSAGELSALVDIADNYDAFFCDIWGVVHNGVVPYPDAVKALEHMRTMGKQVVLVTNAPSSNAEIARMLSAMGVSTAAYDGIVSSGEVTRAMMEPYRGQIIHHVGRSGDDHLFDGLDLTRGPADKASCVIVTELEKLEDTPQDYQARMQTWLDRDLPFICVNPDKLVEVGEQMIYCPGSIADIYEHMGGKVIQAGKPYPPIYQAAHAMLKPTTQGPIQPDRILAIGDSTRTDAMGAAGQGFDFLFITGSLHAEELDAFGKPDAKKISALVAPTDAQLAGFQARLH